MCTISISDSAGNKELWRGARSTLAVVSRRKNSGVTSDLIPWCLQRCNSSTTATPLIAVKMSTKRVPNRSRRQAVRLMSLLKSREKSRTSHDRDIGLKSSVYYNSCTHHHCHGHAIAVIRIFVSAVERGIVLHSKNADCHLLKLVLMGAHFWSRFSVYNKITSTIYCSQSAFGIWSHSR